MRVLVLECRRMRRSMSINPTTKITMLTPTIRVTVMLQLVINRIGMMTRTTMTVRMMTMMMMTTVTLTRMMMKRRMMFPRLRLMMISIKSSQWLLRRTVPYLATLPQCALDLAAATDLFFRIPIIISTNCRMIIPSHMLKCSAIVMNGTVDQMLRKVTV